MPEFGQSSYERLGTCHPLLIELMEAVVLVRDCSIVCGYRGKDDQNQAFVEGKSQLQYPNSNHNQHPSIAVDVVPWPEKWGDEDAFLELKKEIVNCWYMIPRKKREGYYLRWGGNWDGDEDRTDQTFNDLPHWELVKHEIC